MIPTTPPPVVTSVLFFLLDSRCPMCSLECQLLLNSPLKRTLPSAVTVLEEKKTKKACYHTRSFEHFTTHQNIRVFPNPAKHVITEWLVRTFDITTPLTEKISVVIQIKSSIEKRKICTSHLHITFACTLEKEPNNEDLETRHRNHHKGLNNREVEDSGFG